MDEFLLLSTLAGVAFATRELVGAAAVLILVVGIDDLVVDGIYFARRAWRACTVYSRHPRVNASVLSPPDHPGTIAVFIPTWDESDVIEDMLRGALRRLQHPRYHLFVGIYPNDPAGIAAVRRVGDPRVIPVVTGRPGPTTKADCLNHLWSRMLEEEWAAGIRFKAVVLHDAEDVVHSMELRVFDRLIERFDMVQIPVLPLPDRYSPWISGHYLDEFAEAHGKDLVVREALGASVPSAGVGCAISRSMLDRIADLNGGLPFDEDSMTEDYELGLKIGMLGGRGILVRMPSSVRQMPVATREHFPATLDAAVRQKARWLTGIALHGWDRLGWRGGLAERWMRLRDRKSIISAVATLFAYLGAAGFAIVSIARYAWPHLPLPEVIGPGGVMETLLAFNALILGWRLLMRFSFTAAAYGPREGLRAVPRALIANLIAILACFRAVGRIVRSLHRPQKPIWDKTAHRFPATLPGE